MSTKRILAGAVAALMALTTAFASPLAAQKAGAARPAAQASAAKVAYIDSRMVLRAAPGYAQAESTFTQEVANIRGQVQKLQTSYDSAQSAFEQQSVVLSPSQRQAKQKELEDLRTSSEQKAQALQEQAAQRERELLDPIQQRVNAVVDAVRADGGFALVFDVGAPGNAIVSADKSLDISQRVIDRLKSAK